MRLLFENRDLATLLQWVAQKAEDYTPHASLVKEAPRLLMFASSLSTGVFEAAKMEEVPPRAEANLNRYRSMGIH